MRHWTPFMIIAAAAMLLGVSVPQAEATLLYENPVDLVINNGNCLFSSACFDNPTDFGATEFTLAQRSTIDTVSFTAIVSGDPFSTRDFDWKIFDDGGDIPGALIASGNGFSASKDLIHMERSSLIFRYTVNIPDLLVNAGVYWLAFHVNGANTGSNRLFWSLAQNDAPVALSTDSGATFAPGYGVVVPMTSLAVSVNGVVDPTAVPLPPAAVLFGTALIGLGETVRRSRRAQA